MIFLAVGEKGMSFSFSNTFFHLFRTSLLFFFFYACEVKHSTFDGVTVGDYIVTKLLPFIFPLGLIW